MRDEDTRATSDDGIAGALGAVRHRIEVACRQAGRDAGEVRLLLATKTVPAASVAVAVAGGADLIGENRVQELAEKDDVLADLPCERHLIGHLQSNKVNHALRYVSCIESLDSVELAAKLQRRLDTLDATVEVFLQVNVSGEDSKSEIGRAHV